MTVAYADAVDTGYLHLKEIEETLSCAHCAEGIAHPSVEREQRVRCWSCRRWNRYHPGNVHLEAIMCPENGATSFAEQPRFQNHAQLLEAHKKEVVEDYHLIGFTATCRKWTVNKNTFNRKLGEWGVAKRSHQDRLPQLRVAPSPQATAVDVARSADYWRGKCEAYERTLGLIEALVRRSLEVEAVGERNS